MRQCIMVVAEIGSVARIPRAVCVHCDTCAVVHTLGGRCYMFFSVALALRRWAVVSLSHRDRRSCFAPALRTELSCRWRDTGCWHRLTVPRCHGGVRVPAPLAVPDAACSVSWQPEGLEESRGEAVRARGSVAAHTATATASVIVSRWSSHHATTVACCRRPGVAEFETLTWPGRLESS